MLKVLSGQPATPDEYKKYREFGRSGTTSWGEALNGFPSALWNPLIVSRLRELISEWMDSGKTSDGELPSDRNLSRAPAAYKAFEQCAGRHPSRPMYLRETNEFAMVVGVNAARGDGRFGGGIQSPIEEADCIFTGLMYADWKNLLCKCRDPRCGRYFLTDSEINRRRRHGIFCSPEHQRRVSAAACTGERRKKADAELINVAAKKLFEQKVTGNSWQSDAALKRKLAEHLTTHIARSPVQTRSGVGLNWVSTHVDEIASELRRLRGDIAESRCHPAAKAAATPVRDSAAKPPNRRKSR